MVNLLERDYVEKKTHVDFAQMAQYFTLDSLTDIGNVNLLINTMFSDLKLQRSGILSGFSRKTGTCTTIMQPVLHSSQSWSLVQTFH
jgi:hypothetical protein